jgi:hypothetical protein
MAQGLGGPAGPLASATPQSAQAVVQGQQEGATPEQKEQYEEFVSNGMQVIHSEETRNDLVKRVQAGDPTVAVADATLTVIGRLEQTADEQGVKIPYEILMSGGMELLGQVIEVAETVGVTLNPQQKEQALQMAVQAYMEQGAASGKIPPEDMEAVMQEAQQLGGQPPQYDLPAREAAQPQVPQGGGLGGPQQSTLGQAAVAGR